MSGKVITRIRERERMLHEKRCLEASREFWATAFQPPQPFWLAVGLPSALVLAITVGGFGYIIWGK